MKLFAIAALLVMLACAGEPPAPPHDTGVREIAVGDTPDYPVVCSRGIVLLNTSERSVSVVDLEAGVEAARIPLPTEGWVTDLAVDDSGDRAFVPTNDGKVFEIDLAGLVAKTLFDDERLYFWAAAWDAPRRRLLLSVGRMGQRKKEPREQETIHALVDGRLTKLVSPPVGPQVMRVRGDRLWCAGLAHCVLGFGERAGGVGVVDLATDTLLRHELLPVGDANDLAIGPGGRIWAADESGRLLGFGPDLGEAVVRNLFDFWGDERCELANNVEVDETRVLVAMSSSDRIFEYERRDGFLSDRPVREYDLTDVGPLTGMCLLPDGRLAATIQERNVVRLIRREDARPFTGFRKD
ncbi:MAG: SMP-30/gluconolactonase/LRE family protein [Planctomycetota bacterium]